MLYNSNHTISISSLSTGSKRTWSEVDTDIFVYINQIQEDLISGFDGAGSFTSYRMFTDGNHETIAIGDRITDEEGNTYEVK
jgi:hypothetical protein